METACENIQSIKINNVFNFVISLKNDLYSFTKTPQNNN